MPGSEGIAEPWAELATGVVAGDPRSVAALLSEVESGTVDLAALGGLLGSAGAACHVVGLTGPPGSGKSVLVARLAEAYRGSGRSVGALLVDPSSPLSGGALLGDRIRLESLAGDPGVFVRSMATRGAAGGLARAAVAAVAVLAASGKDVVLVETVGTGQNDLDVLAAVDTLVLVHVPGLGDGVQAEKAGIAELAHVHVVNKADRPGADALARDLEEMLAHRHHGEGLVPPVVRTVATEGRGIDALVAAIEKHRPDRPGQRGEALALAELRAAADGVVGRYLAARHTSSGEIVAGLRAGRLSAGDAARALLRAIAEEG